MARGKKRRDCFSPVLRVVNGENRFILDVPAKISGRRIRQVFDSELLATQAGDALREQIQQHGVASLHRPTGKTLAAAGRMFLEYKRPRTGARNLYLVKTYLDDMTGFFGPETEAQAVTGLRLEEWFSRPEWAAGTRFQAFAYARMFFNWLERHDFIERNPARRCEPPKKGEQKNHCLPVRDWQRLVKFTEQDAAARGWVCLGLFAGLRTIEIQRLDWLSVNFTEKEIHVSPAEAKQTTGVRDRYVPMTPAFLRHCPRGLVGPVVAVTERNFRRQRDRLTAAMGWECWPENCLRDTFASNDLAHGEDANRTAYRLGHSDTKMVNRVYARAVKRADAAKWWKGNLT